MAASVVPGSRASRLRVLQGGTGRGAARVSDEELIQAFERGDRGVAAQLYDRLVGVVEGTLFRVLGSRGDDHEDLVQSAFEQIMVTLARGRFARACSLRAWAATVTTHLALNAIRSRTRDRRFWVRDGETDSDTGGVHAAGNLEREVGVRDELERVKLVLAAMKPEHANALVLHDVLGHEVAEIAVLTGISVSAAQSRLFRARAELHRRLEEALGEPDRTAGEGA